MRIVSEEEIQAIQASLKKIEEQVRLIEEERRLLIAIVMGHPNGDILVATARVLAKAAVLDHY